MGWWSKLFGRGKEQEQAPVQPRRTAEDLFVELYMDEARRHPRVVRVERGEGDEMLVRLWTAGSDAPSQAFLKNTFLETRESSPEEKLLAIRRLLSILDLSDEELTWEEASARLVPLLRLDSFAAAGSLVSQTFAPFLRVFIGVDHEATVAYVTEEKLRGWAQAPDSALEQAYFNLRAHVDAATAEAPDVESYDEGAPYPIWHVTRDDSYETSRLALPGYLASFRGRVAGSPIAVAPHRRLLVVSGDAHAAAIVRLAQMAENEFNAAPRPLSPAVYTLDATDAVVPLRLPPEHPQHLAVERGHLLLAATSYGEQKEILEERFEQDGTDVFVATYSLFSDKHDERLRSYCTLAQGVDALLPSTDLVALIAEQEGAEPLFVPWSKLLELAPECVRPEPEHDPPRFRVVGWPDAKTLAALAQHAFPVS